MTPVRQRTIDELRRRNYADRTMKPYLAGVAASARFHKRSPELLGADDVRRFPPHMRDDKGLSLWWYNTVTCALRFFSRQVMGAADAEVVGTVPFAHKGAEAALDPLAAATTPRSPLRRPQPNDTDADCAIALSSPA